MLWSLIGTVSVMVLVPANLFAADRSDKIVTNAHAIFTKAGGTSKDGLTQKQFQAAEEKIDDAMDRLARAGIIGGDTPPPVVIKRDLSKRETISYNDFLQYFRGLASERDLELRRAQVDQAVAQQGAAQAAANAAWADAQQARAEEEAARQRAQARDHDRDRDSAEDRLRRENAELERRNAELRWYAEHPRQPVPNPQIQAGNPLAPNGLNPGGAAGTGRTGTPVTGTPGAGGKPNQPIGAGGAPIAQKPPAVGSPIPPGTGAGTKSPAPGPSGGSPSKGDKPISRVDKPAPKSDKKSDDKSKK